MTLPITEVHNAWAIYGIGADGSEAEQKYAEHSRPQDWGSPRWHYERFRFEWEHNGRRYINHAHCYTDLVREPGQYPELFASLIVMILMPGTPAKLCSREYLNEDDFWEEAWGPMPPYYDYYAEQEDQIISGQCEAYTTASDDIAFVDRIHARIRAALAGGDYARTSRLLDQSLAVTRRLLILPSMIDDATLITEAEADDRMYLIVQQGKTSHGTLALL